MTFLQSAKSYHRAQPELKYCRKCKTRKDPDNFWQHRICKDCHRVAARESYRKTKGKSTTIGRPKVNDPLAKVDEIRRAIAIEMLRNRKQFTMKEIAGTCEVKCSTLRQWKHKGLLDQYVQ